jgi:Na+/proline symporter
MSNVAPNPHGFHVVDYAIFVLVLLVSIGIGLYHACSGGKQRTTKEFFLANRQMKTLPVALSILVSFISGILVLGTPAEMYTRGTQLFMRTFGYCLACWISSLLFVPLFFNLKVTSSFEVARLLMFRVFGTMLVVLCQICYCIFWDFFGISVSHRVN